MSVLPELPVLPLRDADDRRGPTRGRLYLWLLAAAAVGADALVWLLGLHEESAWPTFGALAAAAAVAQAFPVQAPDERTYHTSVVFLLAGALLLPPGLLVLIPLVLAVPARLRQPVPWRVQALDTTNLTLDVLAAWAAAQVVAGSSSSLVAAPELRFALAGLAASAAFVTVNHVLAAGMLEARGEPAAHAGRVAVESLSVDLVLTVLGVSLAAFWQWNPWLLYAALGPLVVVHRSLSVPRLEAEARTDPKTGLYNARHFAAVLAEEVERAVRFERPLAVIMADLDHLREINNAWGHLAGDAVLTGIADAFRAELRGCDVAARFGGEEFSILLPETSGPGAFELAERIRHAVEEREFAVATAPEPLRATISMGVAVFPEDGLDGAGLLHRADLAVYQAKLLGRNRVVGAGQEPGPGGDRRLRLVRGDDGSAPDG